MHLCSFIMYLIHAFNGGLSILTQSLWWNLCLLLPLFFFLGISFFIAELRNSLTGVFLLNFQFIVKGFLNGWLLVVSAFAFLLYSCLSSWIGCWEIKSCRDKRLELEKANMVRCKLAKTSNERMRLSVIVTVGLMSGFLIGVSYPSLPLTKLNITAAILHDFSIIWSTGATNSTQNNRTNSKQTQTMEDISKIWLPSNPKGAERLPPGIVASKSDLYLRRLWGKPSEDLPRKPKYLVTFTVGYDQKDNIDAAVKKFSENFTILLFHYDGRTTEWDGFEWSKQAIHVSARKQTKWWFAKRFLHPDIIAPYDYIFIWDEDLGLDNFNAEEYIKLVKKYGLEISQPGLEPTRTPTWQMTRRRTDREVHKETEERPGWCHDPHMPPCAAFVEIMAPVFSREAWRCVWHMIQNDLIHGWGLDLALRRCVEPAHEKIGVVDAQWIVHQTIPSLGNQGQAEEGRASWQGVRERCNREWGMFRARMETAEKSYYKSIGIDLSNSTATPHS